MPLRHAVALELLAHVAFMLLHDAMQTGHQIGYLQVFAHLQVEKLGAALLKTDQRLGTLAQRLARNRAIVDTGPPDAYVLLDDHCALSEFRPLNGSLLP